MSASLSEYLTINSVILALDGAWELIDPTPLLGEGPGRGSNRIVPGVAGETYRPKVRGAWRDVLQMDVFGDKNHSGTPYADYRVGMRTNVEYLRTQLLAANVGSVPITYTMPTGTRTGTCEVVDMQFTSRSQTGNWTVCAMELVVLGGRLVAP
jgi:hypothetical protein